MGLFSMTSRREHSLRDRFRKFLRYVRSMVLVLPPAPAARVLAGLALATLSARSAAAFRLTTVFAPPGGDDGRAVVVPGEWGLLAAGEEGSGED